MIVARSPRPVEATPTLDLNFINQHLEEKEGIQVAESDLVHCQALFDGVKDLEPRVLYVSAYCLYLFYSTAFKRSVYQAPLMQLCSVSADVAKDRCVADFRFDQLRTKAPLELVNTTASTIRFSIVVGDVRSLHSILSSVLSKHNKIARLNPKAFKVDLTLPQGRREFSQLANFATPAKCNEFVKEAFLAMYLSAGMIDKRRGVADFLAQAQQDGEEDIDLDVFQCMCTGFDPQMDLSALGQYLLHDTHFNAIRAVDVNVEDRGLTYVLQTFHANTTIHTLQLKNTGLSDLGCPVLSRVVSISGNVCGLQTLELCDDALDLVSVAAAFPHMPRLTSLTLRRITQKMQRKIRQQGTAGFDHVFAKLPPTLTHLDVSHNFLTPRDSAGLYEFLTKSTSLQALVLFDCAGLDISDTNNTTSNPRPKVPPSETHFQCSFALSPLTTNTNLHRTLTALDISFLNLAQIGWAEVVANTISHSTALGCLVLDGCKLSAQKLASVIVAAVIDNSELTDVCLSLRDLKLQLAGWRHIAQQFERGQSHPEVDMLAPSDSNKQKQSDLQLGKITEVHLDRNELGVAGICAVCRVLAEYPPLRVLSVDQNLMPGEVLSTEDQLIKTGAARSLLDSLSSLICRTTPPLLASLSLRGSPSSSAGCLGPLACQHVLECVGRSTSITHVELCYNNLGEQGIQAATRAILLRKASLRQVLIAPDRSLSFAGWQALSQCVDRAGVNTLVATTAGLDELFQETLKGTQTKRQHELIATIMGTIRSKIIAIVPGGSTFSSRRVEPLSPREDFSYLLSIPFDPLYSPASNAPSTPVGFDSELLNRRKSLQTRGNNGTSKLGKATSNVDDNSDSDSTDRSSRRRTSGASPENSAVEARASQRLMDVPKLFLRGRSASWDGGTSPPQTESFLDQVQLGTLVKSRSEQGFKAALQQLQLGAQSTSVNSLPGGVTHHRSLSADHTEEFFGMHSSTSDGSHFAQPTPAKNKQNPFAPTFSTDMFDAYRTTTEASLSDIPIVRTLVKGPNPIQSPTLPSSVAAQVARFESPALSVAAPPRNSSSPNQQKRSVMFADKTTTATTSPSPPTMTVPGVVASMSMNSADNQKQPPPPPPQGVIDSPMSPSSTVVSVIPPRVEMGSWEDEQATGVVGCQLQLEPKEDWVWRTTPKPHIRKLGRQSTAGSTTTEGDPRKRKMSLMALFDSFSHKDPAPISPVSVSTPTLSDAADYAARSEAQAEHMRLLLRVCNKADVPITEEDRAALIDVLFSLSASQQADYQARARSLLMPYIPSSKFKRKSAMGGVPDVTLSKYSIAFHAGTELQPLAEVQYETVSIVSRASGKVTFEVEAQPESKWPEYKFTVYPRSGILKKGKAENISISFMAQQKVDLKDLIVINVNGVHRLLLSIKADAEVPVFGVDPYSLDLVSMNGVVLPRILDHMRSYLTNHGGLKLPGIFHRTPDSVLCYAIKQQINRTHTISTRANPESLMCIAHLIKTFFTELPQALLNPLPLGTLVLVDPEQVSAAFTDHLSTQAMSLFVWVLDLMTDVMNHAEWNQITMKNLVEEFAPCLHTTEHQEKVKALLFQQLAQSVKITATSHRTASLNQMTNHATLKARVGRLIPSQSFTSSAGGTNTDDQSLPPGWKLFYTKTPRKRPFYHNQKLQRTQWHRPTSDGNMELPPGWTVHRTKTPQQRMFFHNKELGVTQWSMPTT